MREDKKAMDNSDQNISTFGDYSEIGKEAVKGRMVARNVTDKVLYACAKDSSRQLSKGKR